MYYILAKCKASSMIVLFRAKKNKKSQMICVDTLYIPHKGYPCYKGLPFNSKYLTIIARSKNREELIGFVALELL